MGIRRSKELICLFYGRERERGCSFTHAGFDAFESEKQAAFGEVGDIRYLISIGPVEE
jgi:hypothetical protein